MILSPIETAPSRYKLRTWLIRHLIAINGHEDLMTKAITLQDKADSLYDVSPAARGAVGREASMSGRVSPRTLQFHLNQLHA